MSKMGEMWRDAEQLRELAEALNGWTMDQVKQDADDIESGVACVGCLNDDGSFAEVFAIDTGLYFADDSAIKMANFYAAANPAAVLSLLDRIKTLEDELATVQKDSGRWRAFLATRPPSTHEIINEAIDAAIAIKEPT